MMGRRVETSERKSQNESSDLTKRMAESGLGGESRVLCGLNLEGGAAEVDPSGALDRNICPHLAQFSA